MNEETIGAIKKIVEELLDKMGFPAEVNLSEESGEEDSVVFNITTVADSNFLIGQHGINLQAVQHLARLIVRKSVAEKVRFVLDVNSYRQQKNQSVIQQALASAEEAISQHRAIIMKPMSNYERRIVHLELSKNSQISTESIGDGDDRKVVIRPSDIVE